MRFLVDECTGPAVAHLLRAQGHEVASVYDETPGISDKDVLRLANEEGRILVTIDKGFRRHIYLHRRRHHGVILLRLTDERSTVKIRVLERLLKQHGMRCPASSSS